MSTDLEEAPGCPFASEKAVLSNATGENKEELRQAKHWCYACSWGWCQAINVVINKPPGNSKHKPWAKTEEVPPSACSVDTVKSQLVPNVGIPGACCCTEAAGARKKVTLLYHYSYFSAGFLDFRAGEVALY